jgi:hypothetical protein
MVSIRALRCLTLLVAAPAASGCGLSKPMARAEAAAIIRDSEAFRRPKFVRVPRQITFKHGYSSTYGQEKPFSISELAQVDAGVAILKLQRAITVDESIYGPGRGALHQFVITPIDVDSATLHVDTPPDPNDVQGMIDARYERPPTRYAGMSEVKRERGWRIEIGTRDFVQVDDVHNWRDANVEVPVNELAIDFTWRWMPNEAGDAFDSGSSTFESFPDSVQKAAQSSGVRMNTTEPMHSRAYFRRDADGKWKLRLIEWTFGRGNPA